MGLKTGLQFRIASPVSLAKSRALVISLQRIINVDNNNQVSTKEIFVISGHPSFRFLSPLSRSVFLWLCLAISATAPFSLLSPTIDRLFREAFTELGSTGESESQPDSP